MKYAATPTITMIMIQIQAGMPPDFSSLMTVGAVFWGFDTGRADAAGFSGRVAPGPGVASFRGAEVPGAEVPGAEV